MRIEHITVLDGDNITELFTYQFETDIELCVIDSDGHGRFIDKENFVAYHPIKTELDIAKEKQVVDYHTKLTNKGFRLDQLAIKCMQANNMLAGIDLPLSGELS